MTVNGQRSRYFGPNGLSVNYSAGASDTNLSSDLYWNYVRSSGLIKRELSTPPPNGPTLEIRSLYAGFAGGYNAYLRSGKLRDPRCKGKPWVRPITLTDLFLRGEQIVTEASSAQFITSLATTAPPTSTTAARAAGRARRSISMRSRRSSVDTGDPTAGLERHRARLARHTLRSRHGVGQPALPVARHRALLDGSADRARQVRRRRRDARGLSPGGHRLQPRIWPGRTRSRPRGASCCTS